jgi:hypothetical protein
MLARAVAELRLQRVDEAVFVDTAPRYGLSLYLGAEVERIQFTGDPHPPPQTQDLHSEVFESEGCRLWLTESKHASRLQTQLRAHAGGAQALGKVGSYDAIIVPDIGCVQR